ncbi:MAG: cytochrome c-type protein NapB [Cellvibrionaceae bacterium]|jgi:cytochrome c-type protein NapB
MMNSENPIRSRVAMIGLAVILLAAVVWLVGTSIRQNLVGPDLTGEINSGSPSLPVIVDEFEQAAEFTSFLSESELEASGRDLARYYELRAYNGAPPIIPHAVVDASFGGNDCLMCHSNGDYVPQQEAFAPIVPHPELLNCTQCHVPILTDSLFVETDWVTADRPELGQAALLGSPPPVPHTLQLRGDCLACHAGPAVPAEIRVTHPERENCLQCHVPTEAGTGEEWER